MAQGLIDTAKFKRVQDERKAEALADPGVGRIVQRAKIRLIGDQLKEARVQNFTIQCDEAAERGGGGTAPSPLGYFTAAIGF